MIGRGWENNTKPRVNVENTNKTKEDTTPMAGGV